MLLPVSSLYHQQRARSAFRCLLQWGSYPLVTTQKLRVAASDTVFCYIPSPVFTDHSPFPAWPPPTLALWVKCAPTLPVPSPKMGEAGAACCSLSSIPWRYQVFPIPSLKWLFYLVIPPLPQRSHSVLHHFLFRIVAAVSSLVLLAADALFLFILWNKISKTNSNKKVITATVNCNDSSCFH